MPSCWRVARSSVRAAIVATVVSATASVAPAAAQVGGGDVKRVPVTIRMKRGDDQTNRQVREAAISAGS